MQLLRKVANMIKTNTKLPKKIYFGISKRCCFDCRMMIESFNQVLEDIIIIDFEGAHNGCFRKNWVPPKGFEFATKNTRSLKKINEPTLEEKMCLAYKQRIDIAFWDFCFVNKISEDKLRFGNISFTKQGEGLAYSTIDYKGDIINGVLDIKISNDNDFKKEKLNIKIAIVKADKNILERPE
jgi:hypothetical protein